MRPVIIRRHAAERVAHIIARTITHGSDSLRGSPLADLPEFSRMLSAAIRRKRRPRPSDTVTLWQLGKAQSFAAWFFLSHFVMSPSSDDRLPEDEAEVSLVAGELAAALLAKPGARRLAGTEAHSLLAARFVDKVAGLSIKRFLRAHRSTA